MDHINRDRGDNRWSNLRLVTACENSMNRMPWASGGFKGVVGKQRRDHIAWEGYTYHDGATVYVGAYTTAEGAAHAVACFLRDHGRLDCQPESVKAALSFAPGKRLHRPSLRNAQKEVTHDAV